MKTTFLIYKDINAEKKELKIATYDEWDAIMKANKGLPPERRRFFYKDCINEGANGCDIMYMEMPLEKYRKLHSDQFVSERTRKENMKYQSISMSGERRGEESVPYDECISDGIDYAELAVSEITMKELRTELAQWKPYGNHLLDLYLSGKKKSCTKEMSLSLGVSEQYFRRKKLEFEAIVKKYLIF